MQLTIRNWNGCFAWPVHSEPASRPAGKDVNLPCSEGTGSRGRQSGSAWRELTLRMTDCSLALSRNSRVAFLFSGESRRPDVLLFEAQSPGPIPLSTLQATSRDDACKTEGQDKMESLSPFL
jgi:hypothetical protein